MRTLNQHNFNYLVAADDFPNRPFPSPTLHIERLLANYELPGWLEEQYPEIEFMFHLEGSARESSDTLFQLLWEHGVAHQIPFIFRTTPARTAWVEQQAAAPFFWAGLSFADAFGPGDEGWVAQAYRSLMGGLPTQNDPSEVRAMVYGPDIAKVCYFLVHHRTQAGWHSLGTQAMIPYSQVAHWVQQATATPSSAAPQVAAPSSLQALGFDQPFFSPEAGVYDYVQNHLQGSTGYSE